MSGVYPASARRRRGRSPQVKMEPKSFAQDRCDTPHAVADHTARANRLAPIRAFCASTRPSTRRIEASGAIIFSRVKCRRAAVVALAKLCDSENSLVCVSDRDKNYDSEE